MKNKLNQILIVAFTAVASSATTTALAALYVLFFVIQPFQKEAVDNGFATWEVVDNATGQTEFQWYLGADVVHNTLDNIEGTSL